MCIAYKMNLVVTQSQFKLLKAKSISETSSSYIGRNDIKRDDTRFGKTEYDLL